MLIYDRFRWHRIWLFLNQKRLQYFTPRIQYLFEYVRWGTQYNLVSKWVCDLWSKMECSTNFLFFLSLNYWFGIESTKPTTLASISELTCPNWKRSPVSRRIEIASTFCLSLRMTIYLFMPPAVAFGCDTYWQTSRIRNIHSIVDNMKNARVKTGRTNRWGSHIIIAVLIDGENNVHSRFSS